jgi:nucleotide-binding universal stress UspA family protein
VSAAKKLLVPIDGSANSLRALAFVIKRVKRDRRLRVCLLNVQPPLPRSLFVTQTMIAEYHNSKSTEALARSRAILAKNHMHAEIVVRIGQTADTIVKFASRRHCEEIVMGTRGYALIARPRLRARRRAAPHGCDRLFRAEAVMSVAPF